MTPELEARMDADSTAIELSHIKPPMSSDDKEREDIMSSLIVEHGQDWATGAWSTRVSDGDFAMVMSRDDYGRLDQAGLADHFRRQRDRHAAGEPTGTWKSERIAEIRDALQSAT